LFEANHYTTPPHTFPIDGEVANLLRACYGFATLGETGVMGFGLNKRIVAIISAVFRD